MMEKIEKCLICGKEFNINQGGREVKDGSKLKEGGRKSVKLVGDIYFCSEDCYNIWFQQMQSHVEQQTQREKEKRKKINRRINISYLVDLVIGLTIGVIIIIFVLIAII